MSGGDDSSRGHPTGLLPRIRASLRNPQLVGESGARKRYLKVQWWVVFWRLLVLTLIIEGVLVNPDHFTSVPYTLFVFTVALAYTALFGYLATSTAAVSTRYLHLIDLLVCASLMFLAHDLRLIFVMAFFSFSCLLSRPTTRFSEALPATIFLSLAYLGANAGLGYSVPDQLASLYELGTFILYYFWGLGFVGFSAVLERASSLELDSHLQTQRQNYRRQLHDDLGNTLCGLHYKIQSLRQAGGGGDYAESLAYISAGYERAKAVLKRILSGLEDSGQDSFNDGLRRITTNSERDSGRTVSLEITGDGVNLSPEVQREVLAIASEAITNSIKHSGADAVSVAVDGGRSRLDLRVSDKGGGFSASRLAERQQQGSLGLRGMEERAELLGGRLSIDSSEGGGTSVRLQLQTRRRSGLFSRVLDFDPEKNRGGVYPFLIRLRVFMFAWTMVALLLETGGANFSLPLAVVAGALAADCLAWIVFRSQLYQVLGRRPWMLVFEQLFFAAIVVFATMSGISFFFTLYLGVAIIANGLFLGPLENLGMTMVLNAGILLAHAIAPESSVGALPGVRYEAALQHMTIFSILAVSAGLAGEFIDSLEGLQIQAVSRALNRQRERLTAETHQQLQSLVEALGDEIHQVSKRIAADPAAQVDPACCERIEGSSTNLKLKLRSIMRSLEEPATDDMIMTGSA